jgi:hypothetical protein
MTQDTRASEEQAAARDISEAGDSAESAPLPFIDEHTVIVDADATSVWPALTRVVDRSFSGTGKTLFARVLGCADLSSSDRGTLAPGATRPGFRVRAALPGRELSLEGKHRFSRYALNFHIEELGDDRTRVSAETRAEFPGLHGRGYRALIIGTGGHVLVVHHMLAAVKRVAERSR